MWMRPAIAPWPNQPRISCVTKGFQPSSPDAAGIIRVVQTGSGRIIFKKRIQSILLMDSFTPARSAWADFRLCRTPFTNSKSSPVSRSRQRRNLSPRALRRRRRRKSQRASPVHPFQKSWAIAPAMFLNCVRGYQCRSRFCQPLLSCLGAVIDGWMIIDATAEF